MNAIFLEQNLRSLLYQRNIFAVLVLLLTLTILVLCCFLFVKSERVIIAPAIVEKEFWVDNNSVSPTYLEQFGVFLGQLLLNKSSQSAASQRTIILRHTDPSYIGIMRQKLIEEEEMLKKQNASYIFYPTEVNVGEMAVCLSGDRIAYANGKQVSSKRESYVLNFCYSSSRLLLGGIICKEGG